ncbi:MAG: hypothetical protein GYB65_17085, partial [Chloroflexi bacterium]|nr:hypothetical protein [Chloroflexota bacterium]
MKQKLLKLVFGMLFGVFVAAVVAEIGLRVMVRNGSLPNRMVADIFAAHATGWTLEPELEARVYSTNGLVEIDVNGIGFRDEEYPRERADDVPRVLMMGDSFTLALETPQDEVFHVLLEDQYD